LAKNYRHLRQQTELRQLIADVEWFIKGMHKPVGKGGAETPELLTALEKRLKKVKRKAALAQPASGGGEWTKNLSYLERMTGRKRITCALPAVTVLVWRLRLVK
jgi:hypothetical protein